MDYTEYVRLVEQYLGRATTETELWTATQAAVRKCTQIIERFGDLDSERLQPYYLAQLAVEHIKETALADYYWHDAEVKMRGGRLA